MHKMAINLAEYLIVSGVAERNMKEEYIYGLEVLGLKCINYGTILVMAILNNTLVPTLFFMICFLALRGRTGGFHSKSSVMCYVSTVWLYVLISKVIVPVIIESYFVMSLTTITSFIVIVILAPLNHVNLELSKDELQDCKKSTRILLLLIVGCIGAAFFIEVNIVCIVYAISGIALDAVLLLIQKTVERRERDAGENIEKGCTSNDCQSGKG